MKMINIEKKATGFMHLYGLLFIFILLLLIYSPLLGLGRFFSFLLLHTVGRTPWLGEQPVARPLPAHRAIQT
jgi:hypothetical protein